MVEDESWKVLVKILMVPAMRRKRCQNQRIANTWMTFHKNQLLKNIGSLCGHLVIDDVEGEDTDGILVRLTAA